MGKLVVAEAVVAHCADSSSWDQAAPGQGVWGARMTMGSDVSAGRSFSLRVTTSRSYDASLICGQPVYAETLLYHATARAMRNWALSCFQDKGSRFRSFAPPSHSEL